MLTMSEQEDAASSVDEVPALADAAPQPPLLRRPSTLSVVSAMGSSLIFGSKQPQQEELIVEDGPFHNTLSEQAQREKAMWGAQLDRLTRVKRPEVPAFPAPLVEPPSRTLGRPPASMLLKQETEISRMLNSSLGRCFTFALTMLVFIASAILIVTWNSPSYRLANQALIMLLITIVGVVVFFVGLPALASSAGIRPGPAGVDWKPYLVFYRLAYFMAMPAFLLLGFGWGARTAFGEAGGRAGQVSVTELEPATLKYFEASDGFVALNLTKGVTKTLLYTVHGEDGRLRRSRWRDSELRVNFEPYSDAVDPTVPPGTIRVLRIAPIFQAWSPCLTRYRISGACLRQNSIVGWAISRTNTLCNNFGSVACGNLDTELDPVYQCSSTAKHGKNEVYEVTGLCGRVVQAPDDTPFDEFSALLMGDGWPSFALPNASQIWVDVAPDYCIAHPTDCISQWNMIGTCGGVLGGFVTVFIGFAAVLDCIVDKRIREARRFVAQTERQRKSMVV